MQSPSEMDLIGKAYEFGVVFCTIEKIQHLFNGLLRLKG